MTQYNIIGTSSSMKSSGLESILSPLSSRVDLNFFDYIKN
ncbi:unnamed protein product [Brugia timori]|uniref:Uncharacterized protein n=1 Tax=Brugia timori TaxID=42155 RepID=A0A0R3Q5D9_9BILA|nr:unnamed protein product [Brugia timori]